MLRSAMCGIDRTMRHIRDFVFSSHIVPLDPSLNRMGQQAHPTTRIRIRDQTANISSSATRNEKIPSASAKAMPMNRVAV